MKEDRNNKTTGTFKSPLVGGDLETFRASFKMQLHKGFKEEHTKHHDKLLFDLEILLKSSGIRNYFIFIDETTNALFSVMNARSQEVVGNLPTLPVMKKR